MKLVLSDGMKMTMRALFVRPMVLIGLTLIISGLFLILMVYIGSFNLPFIGESESMGPAIDSHSWGCNEGDILQGSFDANGLQVNFHIDYFDHWGVVHENVLLMENVTQGDFHHEVEESGIYNLIIEGDLNESYSIRTEYVKVPETTLGIARYGLYQSIVGVVFIVIGFFKWIMEEGPQSIPDNNKLESIDLEKKGNITENIDK